MNSEKLNRWLTLLANFGVVVGLALLIVELRQSQNLAETEAAVRRLDQMQTARVTIATSDELAAIRIKAISEGVGSLIPVELYKLQQWESSVRLRMQSHYIQYTRGYLNDKTADKILQDAADSLPYWESLGYALGDSDFEQAIRKTAGR